MRLATTPPALTRHLPSPEEVNQNKANTALPHKGRLIKTRPFGNIPKSLDVMESQSNGQSNMREPHSRVMPTPRYSSGGFDQSTCAAIAGPML